MIRWAVFLLLGAGCRFALLNLDAPKPMEPVQSAQQEAVDVAMRERLNALMHCLPVDVQQCVALTESVMAKGNADAQCP